MQALEVESMHIAATCERLRACGAFAGEGARGPSKTLEWCSLNVLVIVGRGIRSLPLAVLHRLHFKLESAIETISK